MKKKKLINDKKTVKINIAVSILLVVVLSFISVGYALYGQLLNINGTVTLTPQGKIAITDVTLVSSKNVRDGSIPAFTDDSIDFNLSFEKQEGSTEEDYQAVYSITIDNGTFYDYDFNFANFQPVIKNSSGIAVDPSYLTYSLNGINIGDKIPALESVTFTLTLDFNPEEDDVYTVDGNMETDLKEQPHGSLLGSIPDNFEGDLRESNNSNLVAVTVTVINSFQSSKTFNFNIVDTSHFELVDSNGNALNSYTINGGTTEDYTIYIKRVDGAKYLADSITTNINLSYSDASNNNCGSVKLLVDKEEEEDLTPPLVSNIRVTINDATSETTTNTKVGSITLNWDGNDPESGVKKYYIIAYKVDNSTETVYKEYETSNSEPQYTITELEDNNYYFKVYGENNFVNKTNTQKSKPNDLEIERCNNDYCTKSTSTLYEWHFKVSMTDDSTGIESITPTAVNRGKKLSATITPNSTTNTCGNTTYYKLSDNITVTMGENTINSGTSAGQYEYTPGSQSGKLTVYGVTGNITVYTTASSN